MMAKGGDALETNTAWFLTDGPTPLTDTLHGIERHPQSAALGELVVETVLLWKKPGGVMVKDNLAGVLAHGVEVEVLDRKMRKDRVYYRVRNDEQKQTGWVLASLLLRLGAEGDRVRNDH